MKALLSDQPGGPETLRIAELPDPAPGPASCWSGCAPARSTFPTC